MITLVFLGKFGDAAPASLSQIPLPAPTTTLSDIWDLIIRQHPVLGKALATTKTRIVHNQAIAHDLGASVLDGDEIAFLPPMSGG